MPESVMTTGRATGIHRAVRLAQFTVVYNVLEGAIALLLGHDASSLALFGFGLDSFVESASGLVVLWRFDREGRGENAEHLERQALRWIGWSFLLLAGYITIDAVRRLWTNDPAAASIPGIVLALVSLVVMPVLARKKQQTAQALQSHTLASDANQTIACSLLSVTLLLGLALNAVLGWWWADPVASLAMVWWLVQEGREALAGRQCCP